MGPTGRPDPAGRLAQARASVSHCLADNIATGMQQVTHHHPCGLIQVWARRHDQAHQGRHPHPRQRQVVALHKAQQQL